MIDQRSSATVLSQIQELVTHEKELRTQVSLNKLDITDGCSNCTPFQALKLRKQALELGQEVSEMMSSDADDA